MLVQSGRNTEEHDPKEGGGMGNKGIVKRESSV